MPDLSDEAIQKLLANPGTGLLLEAISEALSQYSGEATLKEIHSKFDEERMSLGMLRYMMDVGCKIGKFHKSPLRKNRQLVYCIPVGQEGTVSTYVALSYGRIRGSAAQFAYALSGSDARIREVPDKLAGIIAHLYMRSWTKFRKLGVREVKAPVPTICRDELVSLQDQVRDLSAFIAQLIMLPLWNEDNEEASHRVLHWNDDLWDEMESIDLKYREARQK